MKKVDIDYKLLCELLILCHELINEIGSSKSFSEVFHYNNRLNRIKSKIENEMYGCDEAAEIQLILDFIGGIE